MSDSLNKYIIVSDWLSVTLQNGSDSSLRHVSLNDALLTQAIAHNRAVKNKPIKTVVITQTMNHASSIRIPCPMIPRKLFKRLVSVAGGSVAGYTLLFAGPALNRISCTKLDVRLY